MPGFRDDEVPSIDILRQQATKLTDVKKVEAGILINTAGSTLISAFTEQEHLEKWWRVERSLIEKKTGGVYVLGWNISKEGFRFVVSGVIAEYEPASMLVIDKLCYLNPERAILGPMKLTVKAAGKENATECYLCQEGYQSGADWDWYHNAVSEAWPKVLEALKNYLESLR